MLMKNIQVLQEESAEVLKYVTRVILSEGSAVDEIQILKLGVTGLLTCIKNETEQKFLKKFLQ
jgi:hypothetical protein